MSHTYIIKPGRWKASGRYFDEVQTQFDVNGETEITHHESEWILDGFMELKLESPVRFFNKYTIQPVAPGKDFTFWTSVNPALGKLVGRFMIIGDTILSSYQSENGEYSGAEILLMLDAEHYQNRGFAFHQEQKLSSWEVALKRVESH